MHTVHDHLLEEAVLVAERKARCRVVKRGERIHKAGGKTAETAVAEARIGLALVKLLEIAAEIGISRQGVRELIKKAEEELRFYEEKLGLAGRFRNTQRLAEQLIQLLKDADAGEEVRRAAEKLAETVR